MEPYGGTLSMVRPFVSQMGKQRSREREALSDVTCPHMHTSAFLSELPFSHLQNGPCGLGPGSRSPRRGHRSVPRKHSSAVGEFCV